jgi:flavin-binding protein dodecin
VIAGSPKGWDEAAQQAVTDAAKTVKNIKHFYVKNMTAVVANNRIVDYRVNGKISFVVEE